MVLITNNKYLQNKTSENFYKHRYSFKKPVLKLGGLVRLHFKQMMILGLHIGHGKRHNNFLATWMIDVFKNEVSIINSVHIACRLRKAVFGLGKVAAGRGSIWFVNGYYSYSALTKTVAMRCGESYIADNVWLFGLLSNFDNTFPFLVSLKEYLDQGYFLSRKYKAFLILLEGLKLARWSLPDTIFITSVANHLAAPYDAGTADTGVLGLYDTDNYVPDVTFPIPGNDESFSCIFYFLESIARSILLEKLLLLKIWITYIRSTKYRLKILNKFVYLFTLKPEKFRATHLSKMGVFLSVFRASWHIFYKKNRFYTKNYSKYYAYNTALLSNLALV